MNDLRTAADAAREALAANPLDQTAVAIRCSELLAVVDERLAGDELVKYRFRWVIDWLEDGTVAVWRGTRTDGVTVRDVDMRFPTAVAALKWVRERQP